MTKQKETKLDHALIAYDRFNRGPNLTVQLIDWDNRIKPLCQFIIPRSFLNKPWHEFFTILRFRFRKDCGYVIPKICTFTHQTR